MEVSLGCVIFGKLHELFVPISSCNKWRNHLPAARMVVKVTLITCVTPKAEHGGPDT